MPRTTSTYEVDDAGLARLLVPRDDILLEGVDPADDHRFDCAEGPFDEYRRTVAAEELAPDRHRVTETTDWELAIPIWAPLFTPLVKRLLRRAEAPEPVDPEGPPRTPPWWSPPDRLTARSASVLSRLCGLSMLAGYMGTTITQTMTFAGDEFGASSSSQGYTLAAVRIGVILSMFLVALSDRRGRQKLLVVCAIGGATCAALGAASPNLAVLGATQTFSRAFSTALALLIAVVAAEEMPAGGRAYAASVLAMTAALGAGVAVMLLPVADTAVWAWRIIYVVPLLTLRFFYVVATRLPESRRFVANRVKASLAGHRGRLALLAASGFFGLMFVSPVAQLQNEFLRDEHGFSALQITLFTLATNTPAGIGIIVGGRLADVRGRRQVGAIGTVIGALCLSGAYLSSGWMIPAFWLVGTLAASVTIPALGVYGPELFPTSLRGRANGWISVAGVLGSSVGLGLAGLFADRFDRIGPGIAILAVCPLIVAGLVLAFYPETAHLELEELNPEDATSALAIATPLG